MSRFHQQIHKEGTKYNVAFGWDEVPGFKAGYFFQVFSEDEQWESPDGEGLVVNEGFLTGISESRLKELGEEWGVDVSQALLN